MKIKAVEVWCGLVPRQGAVGLLRQVLAAGMAVPGTTLVGFCGRLKYQIARFIEALVPEFQTLAKQHDDILASYRVNPANVSESLAFGPDSPTWPKFVAEWQAVLDTEIEVPVEPLELPPEGSELVPGEVFLEMPHLVTIKGEPEAPKADKGPKAVVK